METIVLITVDSLRADHVGAYGYDRETTPTIDGLAAGGHTFERAFSHAGATKMSFPSILTSSTALMYGGFDSLSEDRTLVAELLDDAGYATGGFHSNPFLSTEFGYGRGFDHFFDAKTDASTLSTLRQSVRNNLDNDGLIFRTLKRVFDATEKRAGVEVGSPYVPADELTDKALAWLDDTQSATQRFLWVHYMDVHHPYLPPAEHQRAFRSDPVSDRDAIQLRRKMLESPAEVTDAELQTLVDLYDAELRFVDEQVGRLLETIDAQSEDSTVIFTSDHGEEFREHGQFSHSTRHDEGIHVPLVIDDGTEPERHEEIVGLLDLGPTIADYADCAVPETFYGYRLQQLLGGEEWPREWVIGEGPETDGVQEYFYRDERWKYIRSSEESLYDIETDPEERTNVAEEHPDVLETIRERVEDHKDRIDETQQQVGEVEVDEEIEDRLEQLGYK